MLKGGADWPSGEIGNDVLDGREGNDFLIGDSFEPGIEGGDDELDGGDGDDQLETGGYPAPTCSSGGAGIDDRNLRPGF